MVVTMTLTEKLCSYEGEEGEYEWEIEVWRRDTLAKANLSVLVYVYHSPPASGIISRLFGGHREMVYNDRLIASSSSLEEKVEEAIGKAEAAADRFHRERRDAQQVEV